MAVAIRLSRGGSKKRPFYRIVVADVRSPRDGRFIERLGTYNPMKSKDDTQRILLDKERVKYWISVGAKPTDRVAKFLFLKGIGDKPVVHEQTKKHKPKAKTLEKIKAKEEKIKTQQESSPPVESTEKKPEEQPLVETKAVETKEDATNNVQAKESSPPAESTEKKPEDQTLAEDAEDNTNSEVKKTDPNSSSNQKSNDLKSSEN